ncbi:cyclic nucleotide-binding domain-containing protein [Azospirillum sp. B510]|uniref:cyclic nucleotide-binding domain-containing protein n=1 Tax=Azospirillum sp. (strain B510) TaxID=137722 RepID=UPI0002DF01E1|nr:cyclic nucleotide-binding domain-containing protein [Azospirillum sp. B510]
MRKGDHSDELFVIVFGQAGVYAAHGQKLRRLGTLERPAAVGEIGVIDGGDRTATVVADTPMQVLVVPMQELESALDNGPQCRRE